MGAKPLMNKARSLKSAVSGALVAVLVAGMGAISATPAQATPATVNVTVSCTADTLVTATPSYDPTTPEGDILNFSFASDCPSTAAMYNSRAWSQHGFLFSTRPTGATLWSGMWLYRKSSGVNSVSTNLMTMDNGGSTALAVGSTIAILVLDDQSSLAGQAIKWQGAPSVTPTFTTQPASASKTVGDALSLSVAVSNGGLGILSYQWKKDGVSLSGKTSATLSIPSVATSDAGSYTVEVTNTQDVQQGFSPTTVTSSAAVVTVAAAASTPSVSAPATATTTPTVAPKAAIEFKIPEGKPVAAAPVDVEVEGLKDQSSYTITVRSTPIIVDQGTIYNSRLKTSIKIPSGLTPGWHSITVDATAADGTPWNEVMYFEVSASGLLKSTSDVRTSNPGAIAFSAGTSSLSSATKNSIKATVKEAGKSAKYTITGTAGKKSGVSDKAVKALAKKRANILKAYLVKLGVSKSSITIKTKVVKQGKKPKASVLALY
jgi:outer membrane protein OmpA-like peptidoglycan-associated protein